MSLKKLIKSTSTYMVGEVLIMAAGFISFPIFTRILTKSDYGTMNLINITLSFAEALSSVGLRHATQRFFPEYTASGRFNELYATTLRSSFRFGLLGTLIVLLVSRFGADFGWFDAEAGNLFALASLLIFIRILSKITGCIYRIREQAGTYTLFAVLEKYAGMMLSVCCVILLALGLRGYFAGLLLGEALVLLAYLAHLFRDRGFPREKTSLPMLREMSSYGMPLIIAGFAGTILSMGDRYIIAWLLGTEAVAVYSVPYNLCGYVTGILVTSFEFALVPLIMAEWAKPDHGQAREQLQNAIRIYCLAALPIICGVIVFGSELIGLVASRQYLSSVSILPYVIVGEMLRGLLTPFIIGLSFYKKTFVLTRITWLAAGLNIALNLALIPLFGLIGSAVATLISYLGLMVAGALLSARYYPTPVPWGYLFRYLGCSLTVMLIIMALRQFGFIGGLIGPILLFVVLFVLLVLSVDRDLRTRVLQHF